MEALMKEQDTGGLKPPSGLEGLDSVTLTRFVLHGQGRHKEAQGDLTLLLAAVQLACKVTETCVRRAGIAKLYGLAGSGNVQGEDQKKLDIIANDTFKVNIESSEKCCIMVSEEEELAIVSAGAQGNAKYAIAFDPLDGSSNIDANVSIGSIFAIYKVDDAANKVKTPAEAAAAILQKGTQMVAAGYAMYGSATNLVISTGEGVNGFTLDPSLGEFLLTHPDIKIPSRGKIYSVNEGNAKNWDPATTDYIKSIKFPADGKSSYSLRYIGSMVADVHRTLFYGGIFIYPADKKSPTGKLRLLYEAAPMAFLMVQAGGKATTGKQDILDIMPTEIHQRFVALASGQPRPHPQRLSHSCRVTLSPAPAPARD
jgi:fructose-1,6-bisphosphatase I